HQHRGKGQYGARRLRVGDSGQRSRVSGAKRRDLGGKQHRSRARQSRSEVAALLPSLAGSGDRCEDGPHVSPGRGDRAAGRWVRSLCEGWPRRSNRDWRIALVVVDQREASEGNGQREAAALAAPTATRGVIYPSPLDFIDVPLPQRLNDTGAHIKLI